MIISIFLKCKSFVLLLFYELLVPIGKKPHSCQSNCKLQVDYMSTKTKFNIINCNHMFHSYSILMSTFPTHSTELYNPKSTLMSVCCVCVKIWHFFHIRDRKYRFEINFWMQNALPFHSNEQRWNFLYQIILIAVTFEFQFQKAKSVPNKKIQHFDL